jgi:uncharacterized protein (DUF3084 family)
VLEHARREHQRAQQELAKVAVQYQHAQADYAHARVRYEKLRQT